MKHYVCEGECGGVSDVPKACESEECNLRGKDLKECDCLDEKHNKDKEE